jgi:RNA polymerase sigma-70 factor, ECF subfamily
MSPARSPNYTDRLFRAAYALCGSRADAEELVRETFATPIKRRRFVHRGGDAVHLMRALRRAWIDHERARPTLPAANDLPEPTPPEPIDWVVDRSGNPGVFALDVERAYDAVGKLSPQLREVIAAVDVLGLSHRDAARALRMRRRTLTSRLHRAREHVAAALEETS